MKLKLLPLIAILRTSGFASHILLMIENYEYLHK